MVSPQQLTVQAEAVLAQAEHGDDAARMSALREREFAQLYADHDGCWPSAARWTPATWCCAPSRLLHETPHVRSRVAGGLAAVLADDYQDADFAQAALLALLCEEGRQVTVTGPEPALADFARAFPEATTVALEHSMRCPAPSPPRHGWRAGRRTRCRRARAERALLALRLRARPGAGRGGRRERA